MPEIILTDFSKLQVKQVHEIGELFGFETRNKYQILSTEGNLVAFAAEQQKGILGFLFRQIIGHWRTFDILVFGPNQQPWMTAHHPFRFFFERLEVVDLNGKVIGAIQKKFSFFTKRFDIEDSRGVSIMSVSSPIWKMWTFKITKHERNVAEILKKWSGILSETFTDKDTFEIVFNDTSLTQNERSVILVASIFVDLVYFERKAR